MMFLLAIVLPPVAVLLSGKPFQAILNVFLTLCLWLPGAAHAVWVVAQKKAETRQKELLAAVAAQQAAAAIPVVVVAEPAIVLSEEPVITPPAPPAG